MKISCCNKQTPKYWWLSTLCILHYVYSCKYRAGYITDCYGLGGSTLNCDLGLNFFHLLALP